MQTEVVRVTPVVPVRDRSVTCASAQGAVHIRLQKRRGRKGNVASQCLGSGVHLTPTLAAVNKTSSKADGAILQNSTLPPLTLPSK